MAVSLTSANAGFLNDVAKVVTAPVRAPIEATRGVIQGKSPGQIAQQQIDLHTVPQGRLIQSTTAAVQKGNDFVVNIPRDAIRRNLGGDWLRAYDLANSNQRLQHEIAFTGGMFLGHCVQTKQCGLEQFAAVPVAAAMRDAYKVYVSHSVPLDPNPVQALSRVVPQHVLAAARWTVGNTPDMTAPGFLNSGHSAFGQAHAVTLGNLMIFSKMPDLNNANDWIWLIHELFHIEQYMRYSMNIFESIDGFAVDYVRNYGGMENEAQSNALARYNRLQQMM